VTRTMPPEKNSIPSCDSLVQQLDRWFRVLRDCSVDVLSSSEDCFVRCSACSSGKAKKKMSCQGGSLKIDANTPICFVSDHDGQTVRVTVTARTEWSSSASPFPKKHSVEVEVSLEGQPKYRAHLDLATDSRREPLFHLQTGSSRIEKIAEEKHFGLLRWPMIPLDLVLVTELILYTFQPREWEAVHQNAEFLHAVRQSEQGFLTPFFQKIWSNPQGRNHSFLAAFCASRQGQTQINKDALLAGPIRRRSRSASS